jgi:quercetin dioxygenase-like cupin family protein
MVKEAIDFSKLNIKHGWELAPGAGPGIEMKMLSGSLDEINKNGVRTRLIRFKPGAFNTEIFVHDYWEEVYMIKGSITLGNEIIGKSTTSSPAYACRPPGTNHGPFRSDEGCLFLEIQYYNNN